MCKTAHQHRPRTPLPQITAPRRSPRLHPAHATPAPSPSAKTGPAPITAKVAQLREPAIRETAHSELRVSCARRARPPKLYTPPTPGPPTAPPHKNKHLSPRHRWRGRCRGAHDPLMQRFPDLAPTQSPSWIKNRPHHPAPAVHQVVRQRRAAIRPVKKIQQRPRLAACARMKFFRRCPTTAWRRLVTDGRIGSRAWRPPG